MAIQAKQVSSSVNSDIKTLREDASRVVKDLSDLSQKASEIGKEKTTEVMDAVRTHIADDISLLKEQAEGLSMAAKRLIAQTDKSIKTKPYSYLIGSVVGGIGLGLLAGRLMKR